MVQLNKHKLEKHRNVSSNPSSLTTLLGDIEENSYLRLSFTGISLPSFSVRWGSPQVTCEEHRAPSSHSDSGTHSYLHKWLFPLLRKISYLRIGAQQRCPCGFFKTSSIWGHVVFRSHWIHHIQTPLCFTLYCNLRSHMWINQLKYYLKSNSIFSIT